MLLPGLNKALRMYESDKVKERAEGAAQLRAILGDEGNWKRFSESASREGGAGWTALFQGLFQTVVAEKKAVVKANASAQADRRLAEAVSLVRWLTEKAVKQLSRKPALSIARHMMAVMIHSTSIFPPCIRDYAKALRSLLSYPPHLENLDERDWKKLMSICWAAALGDRIVGEEQWEDEGQDELDEEGDNQDDNMLGTPSFATVRPKSSMTQATSELLSLIPLLLSSPSAPILPPFPSAAANNQSKSLGYSVLLKAVRFLDQHPTETTGHIPVLKSCNLVMIELELNSRTELVEAGSKLLPKLIDLWPTRDKTLREQVLIALRLLHPWLSHSSVNEQTKEVVRDGHSRLVDYMSKESSFRWGIEPLDLHCLRIQHTSLGTGGGDAQVYGLGSLKPGFDFSHEMAFTWAVMELYAAALIHLSADIESTGLFAASEAGPSTARNAKRRRLENPLESVLSAMSQASGAGRLLRLQVLLFVLVKHLHVLRPEHHDPLRTAIIDLLDCEDETAQSWAFLCAAALAESIGLSTETQRAWASAMRKVTVPAVSRAASHAAHTILAQRALGADVVTKGIGDLLRQIDLQGPAHPYDTVCGFLASSLEIVQADIQLYSQNLEDKVIAWLERQDLIDGPRGRSWMDGRSPVDVLRLLSQASGQPYPAVLTVPMTALPECPIVERILEEAKTGPIRRFVLSGEFPAQPDTSRISVPAVPVPTPPTLPTRSSNTVADQTEGSEIYLSGRSSRISAWIKKQLTADLADWRAQIMAASKSAERVRKSLDLAALGILFQAVLRRNGIQVDIACLEAVRELLQLLKLEIVSASTPALQLFLWRAFEPLLPAAHREEVLWPISIPAEPVSGIRSDLLPKQEPSDSGATSRKIQEEFLVIAWTLPEVSDSLTEILDVARKACDKVGAPTPGTANGSLGTPQELNEEDDFGEIRIADSSAMPVSKEALDGQRTVLSLMRIIVAFRLSGAKFLSGSRNIPRDTDLLNILLEAKGSRMLQLGRVITQAVIHQELRLGPPAVDAILGHLEESMESYGYVRDEAVHILVISFLRCSAPIWLAAEMADSIQAERAMTIASHIVRKSLFGEVASWRVRLHILVFLDDYLDYEPDFPLWSTYVADEENGTRITPPSAITSAMIDRDMRVRARAATSTAGLFYLPEMPPNQHQAFYIETMNQQPRQTEFWNAFLTDLLWKLNCCIASALTRPAALYHLYEVPFSTSAFDLHLERGLEAVAERLGLASIRVLWTQYMEIIVPAMRSPGTDPLGLAPGLCGFPDRKSRALSELSLITPVHLADDESLTYFNDLCDVAETSVTEQTLLHLYPTIARCVVQMIASGNQHKDKNQLAAISRLISNIPHGGAVRPGEVTSTASVEITALLFDSLHLDGTFLTCSSGMSEGAEAATTLLQHAESLLSGYHSPAVTGRVSAAHIVRAVSLLERNSKSFDRKSACFNTLLHLFGRIDTIVLADEQRRCAAAIILAMAVFTDTLNDGRILQYILLETVSLLDCKEIRLAIASVLEWGFQQVIKSDKELPRLADILARLGRMRNRLDDDIGSRVDQWIAAEAPAWRKSSTIWTAVKQAAILWPEAMVSHIGAIAEADYGDVADLLANGVRGDVMSLCDKLAEAIDKGDVDTNRRIFNEQSFWQLKRAFSSETWTSQGAQAFTSVLASATGQVSPAVAPPMANADDVFFLRQTAILKREPSALTQTLVVRHLFKCINSEERGARSMAYSSLRHVTPSLGELMQGKHLPQSMLKEIQLLRSPIPNGYLPAPKFALTNVRDAILTENLLHASKWMFELAIRLCDIVAADQKFYAQLRSYIVAPTTDLRAILPLLVQGYISASADKQACEQRRRALEAVFSASLRYNDTASEIQNAVLDVMRHLRSYYPPFQSNALAYNHWLDVDHLLLAESAIKVGAFATALLFLEIAKTDGTGRDLDLFDGRVQKVMLAVYSNLDDPDGFYGVKMHNVNDSLRLRLDHEGQHLRSFGLHGADLEASTLISPSATSLLSSARDLHLAGLHRTALSITHTARNTSAQVDKHQDLFFEIAWRTGDWDLPASLDSTTTSAGSFYFALRSLHRNRDHHEIAKVVDAAMQGEMLRLRDLGTERISDIQHAVDNLLALREISLWQGPAVQRALAEGDYKSTCLTRYANVGSSQRYASVERLHATRMSIILAARARESQNLLGDLSSPLSEGLQQLQIQAQLNFSAYARAEGNIQAATNAITAAQTLEGPVMSAATADEYGQVLWTQKEYSLALQLAEGLKRELDPKSKAGGGRLGILIGRIANWSYRARLLPVKEATSMFQDAYAQLTSYKTQEEELANLSHDFAVFAAEQQAIQRVAPELVSLRDYRDRKMREVSLIEESTGANRRQSRGVKEERAELQLELESDARSIKDHEERIDTLTKHALKMFAHALRYSDKFDDSIIKMCALWLAHCDPKQGGVEGAKRADAISKYWNSSLENIPSRKFVFLGPQLAARLHKPPSPTIFNSQLNGTLMRLGREHPYHILYQIIPLALNAASAPKAKKGETTNDARAVAASDILAVLQVDQVHVTARSAVAGMMRFANAAMPWCLTPPSNKSSDKVKTYQIPANQAIIALKDIGIPVATVIPAVRADLDYSSVPRFSRYSSVYTVLGGVHRPKRMSAYDDQSCTHLQLFKGDDEIRQDAVMEQVFELTNKTLANDRQTKTRNLRFRTYVVVPLANKTGILEFVAEGIALGDWLRPAHEKYRRGIDIPTNDFRDALRTLQEKNHNDPKIKVVYDELILKFRPVMRHFFTEKHKEPMSWFSMRLKYSRSAAVTSMVGWILGIGDRHLSNIMIDQDNGELIHIDFGIVFEAGKGLRIPEKVPFRLTNDMLDGLGITGVDGTFRRCSEQTIRVLRENSDLILTVLEVFKHDPLYAWESDSAKLQRIQGSARVELNQSSTVQEKADRVLGEIRQKLSNSLSPEYTVNMLVQEATSTENLAMIYHGWSPWY